MGSIMVKTFNSPQQIRRQALEWALETAAPGEAPHSVIARADDFLRYWLNDERPEVEA
jgi:hypothetical protein